MSRLRVAPAIAAAAILAAPAAAQTRQQQGEQAVQMIKKLVEISAAYNRVVLSAEDLAEFDISGVQQANGLIKQGANAADAKQWSDSWIAQAETRRAAVRNAMATAPPLPKADFNLLAREGGPDGERLKALEQIPAAAQQSVDAIDRFTLKVETDIAPAVQRDPAAVKRLGFDVVDGATQGLMAENATYQVNMAATGRHHPQYALASSITASNSAMMDLIQALGQSLGGATLDMAALQAKVSGDCATARQAAQDIAPLAATTRVSLDSHGALSAANQARLYHAWDTFADSAQVELQISDVCDQMASGLGKSGANQRATIAGATQGIETQITTLVQRRVAISQDRQNELTQLR